MMSAIVVCMALVALVSAYPNGPPVTSLPEVCGTMHPSGHGVAKLTTAPPFEIVVQGTCYTDGLDIPVRVRVKQSADTFYEGLFVQARMADDVNGNSSHGTFDVGDDHTLQTLDCFNIADNAMGHKSHAHYTCKSFTWRPPANHTGDIQFRATIVHEKDEYWEDVLSAVITHDADCAAPSVAPCDNTGGAGQVAGYISHVLLITTALMATLV